MEKNSRMCCCCNESVHIEAIRCPYCGNRFSDQDCENSIVFGDYGVDEQNEDFAVEDPVKEKSLISPDMQQRSTFIDEGKEVNTVKKVFFVTVANLVPFIGQIFGVIVGMTFTESEKDQDTKTFGYALITVSAISFIVTLLNFYLLLSILLG
jgi:hypothetical protein